MKAARNSAIGCACLLAVIEGVGIGIQRMMAENTRLDVSGLSFSDHHPNQIPVIQYRKRLYQASLTDVLKSLPKSTAPSTASSKSFIIGSKLAIPHVGLNGLKSYYSPSFYAHSQRLQNARPSTALLREGKPPHFSTLK